MFSFVLNNYSYKKFKAKYVKAGRKFRDSLKFQELLVEESKKRS